MIIYEIKCLEYVESVNGFSVYFSNLRKASSFVAQNKKSFEKITTHKLVVPNKKCEIMKFLKMCNSFPKIESETVFYDFLSVKIR